MNRDTRPLPIEWKRSDLNDISPISIETDSSRLFYTRSNDYAYMKEDREMREFLDSKTIMPTYRELPSIEKYLKKGKTKNNYCKRANVVDNTIEKYM